jgi:Starch-binding associating with outer membrane
MKKVFKYALLLVLVITVGISCKKSFTDINENPNSPTDVSITPNLILPRSLNAIGARMATSYGAVGQWMGYWARGGDFGPSAEAESYNITTTFEADEFSGWYDILFDVHTMQQKAIVTNQTLYVGIAKILKVQGFMYLVDQYNNVPYSKAFDLANNVTPTYDKGSDIYVDLNKQLNEAVDLINAAVIDNNTDIVKADIMFAGNKNQWIKYANTLHLKLLLRQAYVPGFNPATEIAKINANGVGYISTTASVNPSYVVDNNKQNPFWNAYKLLYTAAESDKFNRANNYVLRVLRDSSNDIRYQYYFSTAAVPVSGNTYYGYNYGEALPNNNPYLSVNSSNVAGPGLAKSATQRQWILTAIESLFLQAEAAERGWITSITAAAAFTAGVNESYNWLGCPAGTATTYLAGSNGYVNLAGSTDRIKTIVRQKYLSLVGVNNFEAWVDWRRLPGDANTPSTCIPAVPFSMNLNRSGRHIPYRLQYPQAEYAYNAASVAAQGNIDPQTSKIFWDVN